MKPFDLQKALQGDPVVMRDGRKVLEILAFKTPGVTNPVRAVTAGGGVFQFSPEGNYYMAEQSSNDLFMAPKVRTVYVNLFTTPGVNYQISTMAASFDSHDRALAHAAKVGENGISKLVKVAHPVEVED